MPNELTALEPSEVSLVKRAANSRRFLLVKSDGTEALDEIAADNVLDGMVAEGLGGWFENDPRTGLEHIAKLAKAGKAAAFADLLEQLKAMPRSERVDFLAQLQEAWRSAGDPAPEQDAENTDEHDAEDSHDDDTMGPPYGGKMKKSASIADTIRASFSAVAKDADGLTLSEACDREIAARASELVKHDLLLDPAIARTRVMKSAAGSALMTLRYSPMADKPFGEALENAATFQDWAGLVADRLRPAGRVR